jgi:hypothetical protein
LVEGCDPNTVPDKALQEKEKSLLEKFKLVLQAFLHEQTDLQVMAVYSLQVYCYSLHFPKGNDRHSALILCASNIKMSVNVWSLTAMLLSLDIWEYGFKSPGTVVGAKILSWEVI